MGYLYIFDHSDGTICMITLDDEDDINDVDSILRKRGMKASQCAWMFSNDGDLDIIEVFKEEK